MGMDVLVVRIRLSWHREPGRERVWKRIWLNLGRATPLCLTDSYLTSAVWHITPLKLWPLDLLESLFTAFYNRARINAIHWAGKRDSSHSCHNIFFQFVFMLYCLYVYCQYCMHVRPLMGPAETDVQAPDVGLCCYRNGGCHEGNRILSKWCTAWRGLG